MKALLFLSLLSLSGCSRPERCIPFSDWSRAVNEDTALFEACIQPNIDCERRQSAEPGLKCKWNDCKMTGMGKPLNELAGYPDRHLVCENDCGADLLGFCLYSGRQNTAEAKRALTGVLEELKAFE